MAPNYPDEVDVFTGPHSRMKQLVHKYLEMVSPTNFRDAGRMVGVLEKLLHTFHAFKAHEQIENRFIMRRLREKLLSLDITNHAVCNCHSDNRLTEMMSLVLEGYRFAQRSESQRVNYGTRLRNALEDFTQDFIPHMKEEEEVFQPMLMQYFTYDELIQLKATVIEQHREEIDETPDDADEKSLPECQSDKEEEEVVASSPAEKVPAEIMMNILSCLSPRDLSRCAQVSQRWNQLALDPSLWPSIHPVQWAAGNWSFQPRTEDEDEAQEAGLPKDDDEYYYVDDEDADKDESSDSDSSEGQPDTTMQQALREVRVMSGLVKYVLPRVGEGVRRCHLAHSRGISSSLVHKILKLCPNITSLTLAHTKITDAAFKEYGMKGGTCKLQCLDLSSCDNITDNTLHSLAGNCGKRLPADAPGPSPRLSCRGRDKASLPATFVQLSPAGGEIQQHHQPLPSTHPTIRVHFTDMDPSFTDLPLELCHFDCLDVDICGDTVPARGGEGKKFPCGCTRCCQTSCDNVSPSSSSPCCSVKKTGEGGDWMTGRCGGEGEGVESSVAVPHALHGLTQLTLNSCYRITDQGLRALAERGGLPRLQHLDLSGCLKLTGEGVASLVDTCQSLDHAYLFYCDNIYPDPYPATASGCRNLECGARFCCRSGQ